MTVVVFFGLPATRLAYLVLFLLVGGESAGVPVPGETALITAASSRRRRSSTSRP